MVDPWRFQAHPEVWLLMLSLIASYVYMVRVIGPRAVPVGQRAASTKQIACFTAGSRMRSSSSRLTITPASNNSAGIRA